MKILARAYVVACMVIISIPCAMAAGKPDKAGCERLRTVKIPNAQMTGIEFVTSGILTPAGAFNLRGGQLVLKDLPRFCRVMGISRPSADSEIRPATSIRTRSCARQGEPFLANPELSREASYNGSGDYGIVSRARITKSVCAFRHAGHGPARALVRTRRDRV